jgi:hypothetical protein
MIDWVIKNREWLFSGIGVAFLLSLVGFLRFIRRRLSKNYTSTGDPAISTVSTSIKKEAYPFEVEDYSKKPSPWDIQSSITATPPFQQPAKSSSYAGLKVQWVLTFKACSDRGNGKVMICTTDAKGTPWVYFDEVEIDRYPRFKIAHSGERILFAGTIVRIEPMGIIVVPDVIRFVDSA